MFSPTCGRLVDHNTQLNLDVRTTEKHSHWQWFCCFHSGSGDEADLYLPSVSKAQVVHPVVFLLHEK